MEAVTHQILLERGERAVDRLTTFLSQGEGQTGSWNQEFVACLDPVGEFFQYVATWTKTAQEPARPHDSGWTPLVQSLASLSQSQTTTLILLVQVVESFLFDVPETTRSLCFDSARKMASAMEEMMGALRRFEPDAVERRTITVLDAAFERVARSRRLQGAAEQGWADIDRGDTMSLDDALARLAEE